MLKRIVFLSSPALLILVLSSLSFGDDPTSQAETTRSISVSGAIVDSDQSPIKQAVVVAYAVTDSPESTQRVRVTTDTNGRFEMTMTVPRDNYRLCVNAYAPNRSFAGRRFVLDEKESIQADLQLLNASSRSVEIVNEDGKPIEGATFQYFTCQNVEGENFSVSREDWDAFEISLPVSDADGMLRVPHLSPSGPVGMTVIHSEYDYGIVKSLEEPAEAKRLVLERGDEVKFQVRCESDPLAVSEAIVEIIGSTETGHYVKRIPIGDDGTATTRLADRRATVNLQHPRLIAHPWYFYTAQPDLTLPFRLHPAGTLRGRVVQKGSDEGAAGVSIHAAADNKAIAQARTDERGEFELRVPAIELKVRIDQSERAWNFDEQTQVVAVVAGESLELDDFLVEPKGFTKGKVLSPSGKPVEKAMVMDGFRSLIGLTDENGEFQTRFRPYGTVVIQALHPTERLSTAATFDNDEKQIELVLGDEGYTYGIVLDSDGKPLVGIPVDLRAIARSGSRGTSGILRQTVSRHDGTFRFLGLSPGIQYRAEVRGESRSSFSKTPVAHGDYRHPLEPNEREPLLVDNDLLEEVRARLVGTSEPPKRLVSLSDAVWLNSEPLSPDDLKGKSVLLCLGRLPYHLKPLQAVHDLYAERGLVVIGVVPPSDRLNAENGKELLAETGISFPVLIDDGKLAAHLDSGSNARLLLYDVEGKLHSEPSHRHPLDVRAYMLYEHDQR